MREPVKGKTEAGRRREAKARETRRRIVEAGLRLFIEQGYTATTVRQLAHAADVAPATVYQAFGTKQAILAAALDVTIAGDDAPLAVAERNWVADAASEPDPRRRLQLVVEGACRIAARTAALKEVIRDAATTVPRARDLVRQDHERRYRTQEHLVDLLLEDRSLRPGIDRRRAVDTFFALVNSATYDLLVTQRGWTIDDWQRWIFDLIERECFEPSG